MAARGARHLVTQGGWAWRRWPLHCRPPGRCCGTRRRRSCTRWPRRCPMLARRATAPSTSRRSVLSRSKGSTFIVADDPETLPAPGDRPRRVGAHVRAPGRLHRRGRDDPGRRVHRRRPRAPRPDPPLRRGGVREHRRHAGRPLLPRRRCGLRARAGRRVHARPRGRRLPRRPPDRRQPRPARHPRLQLRLLRRVEEGRPQDVEQDRPRPRRPGAPRRVQDHPDAAGRPGRADRRPLWHRQDDDHLHAPERVAPGPGRLRRVVARRLGLGDRGRLLRKDVRAQPEGRAHHLRRRHPPGRVPREREPVRRGRGRLLRPGLHQERPRGLRVRRHRGGRPRRGRPGRLPARPEQEREHHPGRGAARGPAGRGVLHARRDHRARRRAARTRRASSCASPARTRSSRSRTTSRGTASSSCSRCTRSTSTS